MNIIGISAYYHDAAACLLQGGKLVAAAAEERFTGRKHDRRLPVNAVKYCLRAGGIGIDQVDAVAYYEVPKKKLARQLWSGNVQGQDPEAPEREIRELLGFEGRVHFFDHHASHAASAFYYSGFERAAIFTVDGVGEWTTTSYGVGEGGAIRRFESVEFPDSLGLLYSAVTSYLGFDVNDGEYKLMGLAPYGTPRYVDRLARLIELGDGGQFRLRSEYFDYVHGERMYAPAMSELLGVPPREPETEFTDLHKDIAASMQRLLEEVLLVKVRHLHDRVGGDALCMAGGVALNCVANARILREGPFRRLFVQPAAGDDGGCLGAAALAHVALTNEPPSCGPLTNVFLGPGYPPEVVEEFLRTIGISGLDFRGRPEGLVDEVARRIASGKVIGWFCGRMEFGPRALGARSILADPRDPRMRDHVNKLVKKREAFRPFAPSVLLERANELFDLDHPAPFMTETCQVKAGLALPAITHVDGSARPQTVDRRVAPRYAALLEAFERLTGCAMLLNTSFNLRGEPIVCAPLDAVRTAVIGELDGLVLEDWLIDREAIPEGLRAAVHLFRPYDARERRSPVYTFL